MQKTIEEAIYEGLAQNGYSPSYAEAEEGVLQVVDPTTGRVIAEVKITEQRLGG